MWANCRAAVPGGRRRQCGRRGSRRRSLCRRSDRGTGRGVRCRVAAAACWRSRCSRPLIRSMPCCVSDAIARNACSSTPVSHQHAKQESGDATVTGGAEPDRRRRGVDRGVQRVRMREEVSEQREHHRRRGKRFTPQRAGAIRGQHRSSGERADPRAEHEGDADEHDERDELQEEGRGNADAKPRSSYPLSIAPRTRGSSSSAGTPSSTVSQK
jgi:hypothetical protein